MLDEARNPSTVDEGARGGEGEVGAPVPRIVAEASSTGSGVRRTVRVWRSRGTASSRPPCAKRSRPEA